MMFKCPKCGKELERVNDLDELDAIPFAWYNNPEVVKKEIILQCVSCQMFRVLNPIDKMKWKIANKLMGH